MHTAPRPSPSPAPAPAPATSESGPRDNTTARHRITTAAQLETIIGRPAPLVLMKELAELDDAARRMLDLAPLAGFGYRDADGRPRSTVVGGEPGFAVVESPTRFAFACDADASGPVSFVFLLPGVGETLRVNGSVAERSNGRIVVAVSQAYVHCARAILRSRLWKPSVTSNPSPATGTPLNAEGPLSATGNAEGTPARADATEGPLSGTEIAGFLAESPFAVVSSWDLDGGSDTSPRGDLPGFVQMIDGQTLVIPDRRGNKRADTFHNLLTDDGFAAALLVPGRTDVLHINGTALVTDDPELLAGMALGSAVPQAALVVTVERAEVTPSRAVAAADLWDDAVRADAATRSELMALTTKQLGAAKPALRRPARVLAVFSRLLRRIMDASYRRALRKEGYGDDLPKH
jgi:uncharacterized protein